MPTDEAAPGPTSTVRGSRPGLATAAGVEDPGAHHVPPDGERGHEPDETARLRQELVDTRLELLTTRDELVVATHELGRARGRIRELEDRLCGYESAISDIRGFRHTPLWVGFGVYLRVRRRLGRVRRRVVDAIRSQ